jgi:hypothetical protein
VSVFFFLEINSSRSTIVAPLYIEIQIKHAGVGVLPPHEGLEPG